jgi:hypothetical protein
LLDPDGEGTTTFKTSGTTGRPAANPVPKVRCSGRIQNIILLGPLFPPQKLKFNGSALSRVIIIIIIIINEYVNLITHNNYLQKEKANLKFLHDMF